MNCIRLDICGSYGIPAMEKTVEQAYSAISECFKQMHVSVWLPLRQSQGEKRMQVQGQEGEDIVFVNLVKISASIEKNHSLVLQDSRGKSLVVSGARDTTLTLENLSDISRPFRPNFDQLSEYHIFISYRWNDFDKALSEGLFMRFSMHQTIEFKVVFFIPSIVDASALIFMLSFRRLICFGM